MRKIQQRILKRNDWRDKNKEPWKSREEGIFIWRWCPVVPDKMKTIKKCPKNLFIVFNYLSYMSYSWSSVCH